MTFWFLSGSRNFCKLLWVSCEVFVLHGYAWIHWVARSSTTTACRRLFRDSQLSLRTLWSAVIKSPKFSARGTTSPLRLLHGALVILVRLQISQFLSLGKWVLTLCLPKSSRLLYVGSRESLHVLEFHHPPNSPWILAATPGSQNSTSRSVPSWIPFYWFWVFIGLVVIRSLPSVINRSWHMHWRGITLNLISSFSSLNFTYCRWRRRAGRRWWAMTLLSWRCPWSWWRSRRRTWQAWPQ